MDLSVRLFSKWSSDFDANDTCPTITGENADNDASSG